MHYFDQCICAVRTLEIYTKVRLIVDSIDWESKWTTKWFFLKTPLENVSQTGGQT